jgi:hypothetical protein
VEGEDQGHLAAVRPGAGVVPRLVDVLEHSVIEFIYPGRIAESR